MFSRIRPRDPTEIEMCGETFVLSEWSLPVPDVNFSGNSRQVREYVCTLLWSASKKLWGWLDEEAARSEDLRASSRRRSAALQIYARMLRRIFGDSRVDYAIRLPL